MNYDCGGGSYGRFTGSLDDVAIYGTALSATRIADHYSAGTTATGSHLAITSTYTVDNQGRTTETISPNGNQPYTVYNDAAHEVRVYPGFNASTGLTTGPIQISRQYWPAAGSGNLFYYREPHQHGHAAPDRRSAGWDRDRLGQQRCEPRA